MFEILVVLFCLIINALLSCIEMSFVSVSKPQLRKLSAQNDKLSQIVLQLKNNPERVLSVLQIGITLVGAISAAVGGAGAEEYLSPYLQNKFQISEEFSESLAIIMVVIPMTFFSVVVGELVPKTLAIRNPLKFARLGGQLLVVLDKFFAPVVFILEFLTKFILSSFFKKVDQAQEQVASGSIDIDHLDKSQKEYVFNLINIEKKKLKEIVVEWDQVTKIKNNLHMFEVLEVIKLSGHTRLPVVNDQGEPIGLLHTKEFIANSEVSKIDWNQLIRPIIMMNSQDLILSALKVFQSNKSHMAIIKNSSQILGIVTLEDILEEIIGDISDEDDFPRKFFTTQTKIRNLNFKK